MGSVERIDETAEKYVEDKTCYYDQVLPKESAIFGPLRRWEKRMGFVTPVIWTNVFFITMLHVVSFTYIGTFFYRGNRLLKETVIFAILYYIFAGFGITAGIHRMWSHKAFKVTKPLKIVTLMGYAAAGQVPIYDWVRDHRVHHKKTDSSYDPHDITRGFFFSHVGWLMMRKHPHVLAEGKKIDMSDITNDEWIVWFDKNFTVLKIFWCFFLPTVLPMVLFGETLGASLIQTIIRYLILLNGTWSVNSFAHYFGARPYNKKIHATQNVGVSLFTMGEGSHNFHHEFPWDYRSTESVMFSITTVVLNILIKLGSVYDQKVASNALINSVIKDRGDLSRSIS